MGLAAVTVSLLGFVVYSLVVNAAGWPSMGSIFFPTPMWLLLVVWVAPALAAFGLAGGVLVSLRVNTVQEAYQLGGLVVLPLVALLISQVTGFLFFSSTVVLLLGAAIWLITLVMLWLGVRSFKRGRLIAGL